MACVLRDLVVIPSFLTEGECKRFIASFENATAESLPTRSRLQWDDFEMAATLWERVKADLPRSTFVDQFKDEWRATGLNPRFRLIKYEPGQSFAKHQDGYYQPSVDERSFATLMVYLNTVPTEAGGATHFMPHGVRIQPVQANAVCFMTDGLDHEGEVCQVPKYILRTDVMFKCARLADVETRFDIFAWKRKLETVGDADEEAKLWTQIFEAEDKLRE